MSLTPPIRILINGAGVAGPALATLLLRSSRATSYRITIVERAAALRDGGQQVDVRAQGLAVLRRMPGDGGNSSLLRDVQAACVRETGVAFVDRAGRARGVFGVNDSGRGAQSLTSEYEIMRGDLVRILYRASLQAADTAAAACTLPGAAVAAPLDHEARLEGAASAGLLTYEFGKHATRITQQPHEERSGNKVHVAFSDGSDGTFDLVIGADGQSSRTRRLVFGAEASQGAFSSLGVFNAFFSIPLDLAQEGGDRYLAKIYHAPGRRTLSTRTGDRDTTQAALSTMLPSRELLAAMEKQAAGGVARSSIEEQKTAWSQLFRDAGWQAERLLQGMQNTKDFYSFVSGQVKMKNWHKGRVVLLGDAGNCPSPNTGMGTTCALVGSYILAGELVKHGENIDMALLDYGKVARPFIQEAQKLPPGMPRWWFRKTELGVRIMHHLLAVVTRFRIDRFLFQLLPEAKGGLEIPEYFEKTPKGRDIKT